MKSTLDYGEIGVLPYTNADGQAEDVLFVSVKLTPAQQKALQPLFGQGQAV